MKNPFLIVVVSAFVFIMSSCLNTEEKKEKAKDFYRSNGYDIKSTQGYNYLLFAKNDTLYLDTEFKNKGKSARRIFPDEKGTTLKILKIDFVNGDGILVPINNFHINFDKIINMEIKFHDNSSPMDKDLLWIRLKDGTENTTNVFYYLGSNEGLVVHAWSSLSLNDYPHLICKERFTLFDVFPNSYYLADYPFFVNEEFSLTDMSFSKLSSMIFNKSDYPWNLIKNYIDITPSIYENDFVFKTPVDKKYLDLFRLSVAMDRNMKVHAEFEAQREAERQREEAERQQEEEMMRQNILNNAIDFTDMRSDYNNPIKAEKKYTIGKDMLLKIEIGKIEYSNSGYTYVLSWLGSFVDNAYVYTSDNSFAELDYPQIVWISAKYYSRHEAWDNSVTYKFTDAQLLLSKEPGLFE